MQITPKDLAEEPLKAAYCKIHGFGMRLNYICVLWAIKQKNQLAYLANWPLFFVFFGSGGRTNTSHYFLLEHEPRR